MIYLIPLISLFAYAFFGLMKQYLTHKKTANIPGPTPLPFLGNALELGSDGVEFLANLHSLTKKYGSVVRLCIGNQNGILLTNPKYIEQVLTAAKHSPKGDIYEMVKPLIGNGLIGSSGNIWFRHRKVINTAFTNQQLKKYVRAFNQSANDLVERLKDKADFNSVDVTDVVSENAVIGLYKVTVDVDLTGNTAFLVSLKKLFKLFVQRFLSPFKRISFLYRFTEDYRQTMECASKLYHTVNLAISSLKQNLRENNADCILDKLLDTDEQNAFTDEELRHEILTFIAAGADALAATVNFGMYELAKHPTIQRKIREEIETVLGEVAEADVSYEDLQQLKYTECVLKEIWRLYTPLPLVTRTIQNEMYLDDFYVPANTLVIVFLAGLHRSENIYPDPERFDPDRFLTENCNNRPPCSFIPFASGVRTCVGQKFAVLQSKVMLTKIFRNFELFQHSGHEPLLSMCGTLKETNGLPLILKLRQPFK